MSLDTWLEAFLFTQVCEVPLWMLAFRRAGISAGDAALFGFAASAITHPVVWFVFPLLPLPYWGMVAAAELFAVATEAVFATRMGATWAPLWSLGANGLSAGLGLGLRALSDRA